jgi:hypothetical protein
MLDFIEELRMDGQILSAPQHKPCAGSACLGNSDAPRHGSPEGLEFLALRLSTCAVMLARRPPYLSFAMRRVWSNPWLA